VGQDTEQKVDGRIEGKAKYEEEDEEGMKAAP
jgi:hypothetical protein